MVIKINLENSPMVSLISNMKVLPIEEHDTYYIAEYGLSDNNMLVSKLDKKYIVNLN